MRASTSTTLLAAAAIFVKLLAFTVNAEEVVTLTEENFKSTIEENEFVLVSYPRATAANVQKIQCLNG